MWKCVALVAALAMLSGESFADEKSHRAAVEDLLQAMELEELSARSMDRLIEMQLEQAPAMQPYRETLRTFYAEHLGWETIREEYIALYMREFSEEELREMAVFYRTPTGQKLLRRLPDVLQEGSQIGARRLQQHLPELQQRLAERRLELEGGAGPP